MIVVDNDDVVTTGKKRVVKRRAKKVVKKEAELETKLVYKPKSGWEVLTAEAEKELEQLADAYKSFLDACKTVREAYSEILRLAKAKGFKSRAEVDKLEAGTKLYFTDRDRCIALVVIPEAGSSSSGSSSSSNKLDDGINLIVAHIDAPRLDLKQRPLYEDEDCALSLFKTHYYGGIKKYQWVNHPLALHGRVVRADGKIVDIRIGDGGSNDEPIFIIPDLLPHLAQKQAKQKLAEAIKGEDLNLIVGNRLLLTEPEAKKKIKLWVLDYLNRTYGLTEEDLISAEIEVVPAEPARDVGFDRSLIAGYGQDARICAFTALQAIMDLDTSVMKRAAIALFVDKEEIGSEGITGIKSKFLLRVIGELLEYAKPKYREAELRKLLTKSKSISGDVAGALNPNFKEVQDRLNAAKLGYGVVITKFTGVRGKAGASDARAEYLGELRQLFNTRNIRWQIAELGKVDEGGGGTVARYITEYGIETIDCGPPVLSMHAPLEIASKVDLLATYQAYKAFFEAIK